MMYLGLILFILMFVLMAPQTRAFLVVAAAGAGAWIAGWAPFSYILLMILVVAPFVAIHLVRSWPVRVDEENPMAKYRKENPAAEDD
jgi:hypothetical protein